MDDAAELRIELGVPSSKVVRPFRLYFTYHLTKKAFLYNSRWPYQFRKIDELVNELSVDNGASTSNGVGIVAAGSADPKAGL
ncbi:carbon-nitrogen hydrolase family protein [Artemisia annua]|uniref:Carbon-nitrogen hydrolase family protein n=1 Tax=Artemisia annua TaxID=35608 RepID=A0A2U1NHC6_ARTAN|nr:carbon-nitrogen hydrolase family protein [Artemisia annua]